MALGGPLKDAKLLSYIPGPGNYTTNRSMLNNRASSMRAKLVDQSNNHLLKVLMI